jgi:hypothetical protein
MDMTYVNALLDARLGDLRIYITWLFGLGGLGLAVLVLIAYVVFGREGDKVRKEIEKSVGDRIAAQAQDLADAQNRIREIGVDLEKKVGERMAAEERRFDDALKKVEAFTTELRERVGVEVRFRIGEMKEEADGLVKELEAAKDALGLLEGVKANAARLKAYVDIRTSLDPSGNFEWLDDFSDNRLRYMSDRKAYEDMRREAKVRFEQVYDSARKAEVDANQLFNAAMVASRLNFEEEALQLFTLSNRFSPSPTHEVAMRRIEATIGKSYEVMELERAAGTTSGGSPVVDLIARTDSATEIVNTAFAKALSAAARARLPQNEIVYAELWNIAQKVREDRGYERMLDVFLAILKARQGGKVTADDFSDDRDKEEFETSDTFGPAVWKAQAKEKVTSNLHGKIAATWAMIGTGDWRTHYRHHTARGVELAAIESDVTTWKRSFLRDGFEMAGRIGEREHWTQVCEANGIKDFTPQGQEDVQRQFLQMLQQLKSGLAGADGGADNL